MFIVSIVSADGPSIGKQWICDSYDKAVQIVHKQLQDRSIRGTYATEEKISDEQGYVSEDGDFAILIGMAESAE